VKYFFSLVLVLGHVTTSGVRRFRTPRIPDNMRRVKVAVETAEPARPRHAFEQPAQARRVPQEEGEEDAHPMDMLKAGKTSKTKKRALSPPRKRRKQEPAHPWGDSEKRQDDRGGGVELELEQGAELLQLLSLGLQQQAARALPPPPAAVARAPPAPSKCKEPFYPEIKVSRPAQGKTKLQPGSYVIGGISGRAGSGVRGDVRGGTLAHAPPSACGYRPGGVTFAPEGQGGRRIGGFSDFPLSKEEQEEGEFFVDEIDNFGEDGGGSTAATATAAPTPPAAVAAVVAAAVPKGNVGIHAGKHLQRAQAAHLSLAVGGRGGGSGGGGGGGGGRGSGAKHTAQRSSRKPPKPQHPRHGQKQPHEHNQQHRELKKQQRQQRQEQQRVATGADPALPPPRKRRPPTKRGARPEKDTSMVRT